jgi:hypothetical protein
MWIVERRSLDKALAFCGHKTIGHSFRVTNYVLLISVRTVSLMMRCRALMRSV